MNLRVTITVRNPANGETYQASVNGGPDLERYRAYVASIGHEIQQETAADPQALAIVEAMRELAANKAELRELVRLLPAIRAHLAG